MLYVQCSPMLYIKLRSESHFLIMWAIIPLQPTTGTGVIKLSLCYGPGVLGGMIFGGIIPIGSLIFYTLNKDDVPDVRDCPNCSTGWNLLSYSRSTMSRPTLPDLTVC